MKITIHISDAVVDDVMEYCRAAKIDLNKRMQQELDRFVNNALWWRKEERRQIKGEQCQP